MQSSPCPESAARASPGRAAGGRGARHSVAPHFLPDNRHFLYHELGAAAAPSTWALSTMAASRLVESDDYAGYASGFLLFVRGRALMAQPFSLEKLQVKVRLPPSRRMSLQDI